MEAILDKLLINQLQFYVPPEVMKKITSNPKKKYQIVRYIIDKEFKHKPQKWKTLAFPEYEDFFQAAAIGFNPYKDSLGLKDKGVLQSIDSYNPYKKQETNLLIENIEGVDQAVCPFCSSRGEKVSLWPSAAGNKSKSISAPEPVFYNGNKYCGKEVTGSKEQLDTWISQGLVRQGSKSFLCNYSNRLASLKNHISKQLGFLVQDIRHAEYHASRSLKRHPHYTCNECHALVPDFNTSSNKTVELECKECGNILNLEEIKASSKDQIVWKARGASNVVSLQDPIGFDDDSKSTVEDTAVSYVVSSSDEDLFLSSNVEEQRAILFEDLICRVRALAASCLPKKQLEKLLSDPTVLKDKNGVPDTLNFQIFYNYFFTDDPEKKKQLKGKAKNTADETSTYRELAFKYLGKEQHYTQCLDCNHKMYEPTESAKFKKLGTRKSCESCNSLNVQYHGPHCGKSNSLNPSCRDHYNHEVVMYIFQTIEPKIRRLETLIKSDKVAMDLYERIRDLSLVRDKLDAFTDMAKILNY